MSFKSITERINSASFSSNNPSSSIASTISERTSSSISASSLDFLTNNLPIKVNNKEIGFTKINVRYLKKETGYAYKSDILKLNFLPIIFGINSQKMIIITVNIIVAINSPLLFSPKERPMIVTRDEAKMLATLFPNNIPEIVKS